MDVDFFFAVVITIAGAAREGDRGHVPEKNKLKSGRIETPLSDMFHVFRLKVKVFKPPKCPSRLSAVEVPVSCCEK